MIKKLTIFFFAAANLLFCVAADVTLWVTADIHGNIISEDGGMAKIAAVLKQKRGKNDILIDAGDMYQGSYSANKTSGMTAVKAFNSMNYDIFVPGNHEMEFGSDILRRNLQEINAEILCCNWKFKDGFNKIKPYCVLERNNYRIGFIGAGERESRTRLLYNNDLLFMNEEKAIAAAVTELRREKVDLIVLIRHGGIYFSGGSLYSLLKLFPEIDIVIGGHTHQLEKGRRIAGAYYVQPGSHGRGISRINIKFDKKTRRRGRITSQYFEAAACNAPELMAEIIKEEKSILRTGSHKFSKKLPSGLSNAAALQKYLALNAVKQHGKADADIFFADNSDIKWHGTLDKYFIYRLFPYENKIVTISVSAKEYEIIIAECRKYSAKYKVPLILRQAPKNKKHIILRTASFVLSGGGRNFPASRRIAEKHAAKIKEYSSLRQTVENFLASEE